MKYVDSGSGKIPLITLLAILSISLTVNLPGLAISPIMGKLQSIFPSASEFEIQLLTVLPNLVIIPFMLIAGKLSVKCKQSLLVTIGLAIYLLASDKPPQQCRPLKERYRWAFCCSIPPDK